MQVMGQGSNDLHEQTKKAMGDASSNHHDFFAPINKLDPHQSKKTEVPKPKFNFRIFILSGAGSDASESTEYIALMNKIAAGEYQQLEEKNYHTVDGGIKIMVKWLEMPTEKDMHKFFDEKMEKTLDKDMPSRKKKKSKRKNKTKINYGPDFKEADDLESNFAEPSFPEEDYLPKDPLD